MRRGCRSVEISEKAISVYLHLLIWKELIDNHYQLVIFGRNRDKIAFLLQGRAQNLKRLGKVE